MKESLIKIKKHTLFFTLVFFPFLFSLISFLDIGGWATLTAASAKYGISSQIFIWLNWLIFALIADRAFQVAIFTKKGIGDLIRERYGIKVSFLIFLLIFLVNQAVILQNLTALKLFNQLFNLPWRFFFIFDLLLLLIIFYFLSLRKIKRIIFFSLFFYLAIVVSTFMMRPNWVSLIFESFFIPKNLPNFLSCDFLFTRLAVMGTAVPLWNFILISSFYTQKEEPVYFSHNRLLIYFLAIAMGVLSLIISVNSDKIFFLSGINLDKPTNILLMVKPFLNNYGVVLMGFGLFSLLVYGLMIVPLITAYFFAQIFGYGSELETMFNHGKTFKIIFLIHLILGSLIIYIFDLSLFKITLFVDFLNLLIFPIFCYFLFNFFYNLKKNNVSNRVIK